jgi:hypothetical protein
MHGNTCKSQSKMIKMKKIIFIVLLFLVTTARSQKVDSLMGIAQQYLSGLMKPYEPKKAFEIFTQCANLGNAKAMNALGVQYKLGLGIDTNNIQAFNWFQKSAATGYAAAWYNLGMMYKQGNGCTLNYANAYTCFKKAADMQDGGGIYAQGYMLYKGFGCTQDYKKAIALFKKGIAVNKASCMYLLGLCFRNGYGIAANADSAKYWLNKSASFGYQFALDELATKEPENSYNPNLLIEKVRAIETSAFKNTSFNQYRKVEQSISLSDIEGIYSGYLIKYDWSGEHIIAVNKLNITLTYAANKLTGLWVEDDSLSVVLNASIKPKFLTFENSQYSKIDHYNIVPERLNFEKAILGLIHDKDSVYLTGNVQLYSPERKEPERPLYQEQLNQVQAILLSFILQTKSKPTL